MIKLRQINYQRISYHILFWIVITVFYDSYTAYSHNTNFFTTLKDDLLFYFPTDILGAYFTIYFLFPRFLYKKKYLQFAIIFLVFFLTMVLVISIPLQYLNYRINNVGDNLVSFLYYVKRIFLWTTTLKLMVIGIISAVKLTKKWYNSQKQHQILQNEKLEIALKLRESELKYLKSQINPHFLFNSLNNLYSLTLEKSDKAPEVVLKISALLDYMLYECNVPLIELNKEIENLKNYIDLQGIRYGEEININIEVKGNPNNTKIAPLLILPLVENAFKHGLDKNIGKGFIDILIDAEDDENFSFYIKNSLNGENNHQGKGIGLDNLRKRLELQYTNCYKLESYEENDTYTVKLNVNLNKAISLKIKHEENNA